MSQLNPAITFTTTDINWFNPVQIGTQIIYNVGTSKHTLEHVLAVLNQISPDNYVQYLSKYYAAGLEKFKEFWGYCDLLTILHAATSILKPINYLEIGVRRGRSLAVAVNAHPAINVYGFDLWMQNYAGMENPGPEFVKSEMKRFNHKGNLTLISGDSKETVPKFFKENPDLYFDIITVDGDHSKKGACMDLFNVLPRLKIGGIILLDDICHPQHEYLEKLWDKIIGKNKNYISQKYSELGYGIAFAIRRN